MTLHVVGSFPLGSINLAASASVDLLAPLLSNLDELLYGPFGLGPVGADLSVVFSSSIESSLQIGLDLLNPLASIQLTLSSLAQIQAALTASLALPVPTSEITAQLTANAATQAALGFKLNGIQSLIAQALAVKLPAVDFLADLSASLSAGPVVVASWGFADEPDMLLSIGAQISGSFNVGIGGLLPTDRVYGVLLVTKELSASAGISATLLVQ